MNAHQQIVERKLSFHRHNDLSIDYELLRFEFEESSDDFGEVACERLAALRLQIDFVAIAKRDATKAVPLRLVLPVVTRGELFDRFRLHWQVGLFDWQCHSAG